MPAHANDGLPTIFPGLRYKDAPAAIEWLGRAFGFEPHLVVPNPDGTIAHAELRLGRGMIMMGSGRDDVLRMKTPLELGYVTQSIYAHVADPDALYARARAAGAEVLREICDTDYGSREFTVRDPEGHHWSFGSYLPGAVPETS